MQIHPISLYYHAQIFPGINLPSAEAMAVQAGKIIAIGNADEIQKHLTIDTAIDLNDAFVFPGFCDAHLHLMGLGQRLLWVNLVGCTSKQEIITRLKNSKIPPRNGWIQGFGWDQNLWNDPRFPTSSDLDIDFPEHKVWLVRIDGHVGWANSLAMKTANLNLDVSDPIGGKILCHSNGTPTGIFLDQAVLVINRHIPPASESEFDLALQLAIQECLEYGITSVHDAGVDWQTIYRYQRFIENHRFPLRVFAMYDGTTEGGCNNLKAFPLSKGRLKLQTVKLFSDGSLGARGAALLRDYSDDPNNNGFLLMPVEKLRDSIEKIVQAGLQPAVHAIGDRANNVVLDLFSTVMTPEQRHLLRPRIEHAQILIPQDIQRFHDLEVIACIQPTHATSDMGWAELRLGKERILGAYAWNSLLQAGACLAGGTDSPIESVDPRRSFYAAVTRQNDKGMPQGGWYPQQILTREQAWRLFTIAGAYASFSEQQLGSLELGKEADFIVTDRNFLTCPEKKILHTQIWQTYISGDQVYSHPQFQPEISKPNLIHSTKLKNQENITMQHPYPQTWWVQPGLFLAGCYPGDLNPEKAEKKLSALLDVGIRTFICLQEEHETNNCGFEFEPYVPKLQQLAQQRGIAISTHRFPIQDDNIPSPEQMKAILRIIKQSLNEKHPVYVHCWGGHGRTGTVVACFLIEQGRSPENVFGEIRQLRQHDEHLKLYSSPQSDVQRSFVESWPSLRML